MCAFDFDVWPMGDFGIWVVNFSLLSSFLVYK